MAADPEFSGVDQRHRRADGQHVRDEIAARPRSARKCRRLSCLHPTICKLLAADHGPLIDLMREAAAASRACSRCWWPRACAWTWRGGARTYIRELAAHHMGGLLKVAPEHADPEVLRLMKKPPIEDFEEFERAVPPGGRRGGQSSSTWCPYFMAGHPGCDLAAMIRLAVFLKRTGYRPDKVQDFIPLPMDMATCMYYTGLDPMTGQPVYVARGERERRLQRALLQFFKPENYAAVREALRQGRPRRLDRPRSGVPHFRDGAEGPRERTRGRRRASGAAEPATAPAARRRGGGRGGGGKPLCARVRS